MTVVILTFLIKCPVNTHLCASTGICPFTWLFRVPLTNLPFSPPFVLGPWLSCVALVSSDPGFPVLLSAFPWPATGKAGSSPVPAAKQVSRVCLEARR